MTDDALTSLAPPTWPASLTRWGVRLIVLGLILAAVSGPLTRFGIVGFQAGLLMLALGVLLLVVGTLLAIVGFLVANAKGTPVAKGAAAVGIVVALGVLGYLLTWIRAGAGVPPIHEISTDLGSPPPFVAVKEIRDAIPGLNAVDYVAEQPGRGGAKTNVPDAQRKAYPDIQPLLLEGIAPADAFARSEAAARALGWEIVASVPVEGRLEATDTTAFFGFKDDVVVRLRAEGGGTRVDVRSKSRVGLGDAGTNAKRVRAFLERVRAG